MASMMNLYNSGVGWIFASTMMTRQEVQTSEERFNVAMVTKIVMVTS